MSPEAIDYGHGKRQPSTASPIEQVDENAPWALPGAIGRGGGIIASSHESAIETMFHPWNLKHLAAPA